MNGRKKELLLYAVTDRSWLCGRSLYEQVEEALQGGVTMVQLREKKMSGQAFLSEAEQMKELCAGYRTPLIINDEVEIARAVDADGVHVGQKDTQVRIARAMLGPDKIIGASARTVEQARIACAQGADYLGVGAVFPTGTKQDAEVISYERLTEVCKAVSVPVVAIGGITKDNMDSLFGSGISGIAVVSAIFAQPDIRGAANLLKQKLLHMEQRKGR
uniref:Thiamine-phosphate synthase n=1 Tax=Eubacterium plexicaudatum ASF492 TaxID=1235802 RepID=N2AED4_9FIRM